MDNARMIPREAMPLFYRVWDGYTKRAAHVAYYLEYLALHLPEKMLVPALEWLLKNNLKGQRFYEFTVNDCKESGLELVRYLTMKLERERGLRVLTARDIA